VGVSQTAGLNRERHLYSAGRPSRWALAHISSYLFQGQSIRGQGHGQGQKRKAKAKWPRPENPKAMTKAKKFGLKANVKD